MESDEIEKKSSLEEISPTAQIPEEINQSLEEYKGAVHDKLVDILAP